MLSAMLHPLHPLHLLHSITNQELFEKHPCNPCIQNQKKEMGMPQLYQLLSESEVFKYPLRFIVSYVQPITQVATMKNTDDFHYEGKPSCATAKSTLFAVSKDEWDTMEDTGTV